jgi:hypothetical protein
MVYLTTGQRTTDQRATDQEKAKQVLMKVPADTPGPMKEGEMGAQPPRTQVAGGKLFPL